MNRPSDELLAVEGLSKFFPVMSGVFGKTVGHVRAVDDISFRIRRGETLGLVGESGCGKTTAGRSTLRLIEPSAGRIWFGGAELTELPQRELRAYRRRMQIVFQDPFGSLNPRMRVVDILGEGLERHGLARGAAVEREVRALLARVGLPGTWLNRYPHEFSGGQRQRIGIARAIALQPELIVCDEAVSALDVSIQAQVVNLLLDLRREMNLAYLFIAHDLSVVRHISDQVAVMYLGRIVEHAACAELFEQPAHPYTRALLSAVPQPNPRERRRRVVLSGDVPSPLAPPSGCHFHPRCPAALPRCGDAPPPIVTLAGGRTVRCVHAEGLEAEADWYPALERRLSDAEATRSARSDPSGRGPAPTPGRALRRLPVVASAQPAASEAPLVPDSSVGSAHDAEPPRALTPQLDRHGSALVAAVAASAGAVLGVFGHYAAGLALLVASGLALGQLSPRWLGSRTPRIGTWLALIGLLAVVLSLWVVPLRRAARARADLVWLRQQVEAYATNVGSLPQSLAELRFRYVERFGASQPRDPWGNPYLYVHAGRESGYELVSLGPDGVSSGDDLR